MRKTIRVKLKNDKMKKLILFIAIFTFAVFIVNAQTSASKEDAKKRDAVKKTPQQTTEKNTNPNAPIIDFEKTIHDYGTMEQHDDGRCEFKFKNTGKEPLILSNVRSSCGCTVPEWPRQPILPGQSEVIKVKYDTKRIGGINKSVYVYSNGVKSPITLKIKGKINAKGNSAIPEKNMDEKGSPVNK